MIHEATLTRPGDWQPVTITCSCGWKLEKVEQWLAWLKWEGHKARTQHRPGFCTPWGAGLR